VKKASVSVKEATTSTNGLHSFTKTRKMAGLRATQLNLHSQNSENSSVVANAKNALLGKSTTMGRSTRTVMGDIGNNAAGSNRAGLRAKDNNAPVQKPGRTLAKQKGTASLKQVLQGPAKPVVSENVPAKPTRQLRKRSREATEKPQPDSMEVDPLPQDPSQDVEMEVEQPVVTEGFSTNKLVQFNIEDIDSEDVDDPQLVVDYVNEIYEYMRMMEKSQAIKKDYLTGKIGAILPKMRSVLVEWLVEVHQQFSLLQETLYLSVAILDRFMQVAAEKIPRKHLQLVGVSAMFIAAKYEEMYAPEIGDFVYITDNAYSQSQIREMEIKIMGVLKFDLGRPLPLHFLRRNSKAGQVDATAHTMAKYVMELTLLEYGFAHILPSEVAAAALAFSVRALDTEDKPLSELWNTTLQYYSQYSLEDISSTLQKIAAMVLTTTRAPEKSKLLAIRKKYSNKKFGKIAEYSELTSKAVQGMANGDF